MLVTNYLSNVKLLSRVPGQPIDRADDEAFESTLTAAVTAGHVQVEGQRLRLSGTAADGAVEENCTITSSGVIDVYYGEDRGFLFRTISGRHYRCGMNDFADQRVREAIFQATEAEPGKHLVEATA